MSKAERIKELLAQKQAIDNELAEIKRQANEERAAFATARKPRKKEGA